MDRHEATEYLARAIGIFPGANLDFDAPLEAPCTICEATVDLSRLVPFSYVNQQQGEHMEMRAIPEADARQLLDACGIEPPALICTDCGELYGEDA